MKYGIREICNVVFRAKSTIRIGTAIFKTGQPVFFMDSAKTSTLEGGATAVYATGGRGNVRLVTWEGEKTLTFTVEDALLSPISFAMLSGAGVVKGPGSGEKPYTQVHAHQTTSTTVGTAKNDDTKKIIDLSGVLLTNDRVCDSAPIFIMLTEMDGSLTGGTVAPSRVDVTGKIIELDSSVTVDAGTPVMVDYYVLKDAANVTELQIDAQNFGGQFYVEADTLFRAQIDGKDYPANITLPNVKIQSNWTFTMAASGDPSTFSFTMDAMPGYTYFDNSKKVLCVIQVIEEREDNPVMPDSVMKHTNEEDVMIETGTNAYVPEDSVPSGVNAAARAAHVIKLTNNNQRNISDVAYYAYVPGTAAGSGNLTDFFNKANATTAAELKLPYDYVQDNGTTWVTIINSVNASTATSGQKYYTYAPNGNTGYSMNTNYAIYKEGNFIQTDVPQADQKNWAASESPARDKYYIISENTK